MAEVLRARAFYMTRSRRVALFGLGVNLVNRYFRFVSGDLTVNDVVLPVYFVGARRYELGTTPASLFIAVFSLDQQAQTKQSEGQDDDDQDTLGAVSLRVTVTNTPTPLGGGDAGGDGDPITIEVPDVAASSLGGIPDVPPEIMSDDD